MNRESRRGLVEVRVQTRATYRGQDLPKTFTAMPLVYDVVDDYGSIWTPGVFNDARMPVLCYGHEGWDDITAVLGRALDYTDTPTGPVYQYGFDDFDIVPTAAQAAHQLESGTLREFSVGFERLTWEGGMSGPMGEMGQRAQIGPLSEADQMAGACERIVTADHLESSIVIAGAVPGTKLLALRSKSGQVREVPEALVVELGRQVAAGTLTQDEAKAALGIVTETPEPEPTEPVTESVPDAATTDAADEALASLGLT